MMTDRLKKILIVDDEDTIRAAIVEMIEELGYVAMQASGGKAAMQMLTDNPDIALVVLDMVMPEVDGRAVVEWIRARPEISRTPVIMISGIMRISEMSELLEKGPSYFIAKPVKMDELAEYISKSLERYSS